MNFLLRLLTWWNGQTLGTQLFTARKGQRVVVSVGTVNHAGAGPTVLVSAKAK